MEVVVDGIIYQLQARGGISRMYNEILPRMCQHDNNFHVQLLETDLPLQPIPRHPNIRSLHIL